MIWDKLSGPIIGAVIGYCTNYIAVKMLFYPRKEVKIFGHKVPFTPGAIPKGKPRLAKAVGNIVANTLLTEEDFKQKILSPEVEESVVNKIMDGLSNEFHIWIEKICPTDAKNHSFREDISNVLTNEIMDSVVKIDLKDTIVKEAERVIKEKTSGTMIAMFLTDDMLSSLIQPVGEELEKYISENGAGYIKSEVDSKMLSLENKSVIDLCKKVNFDEENIRELVNLMYHNAVESAVGGILKNINISNMVEEKINEMKVEELEKMVLTVMKKELDIIVNLGALIGGILGVLNMFF